MSGPQEVSSVNEPPEFGICPFISTTTLIPGPVPGIASPAGRQQVALRQVECASRCVGPECGVWSQERRHCSLVCLSEISNSLRELQPSSGGGALGVIASKLEELSLTLKNILNWFNNRRD